MPRRGAPLAYRACAVAILVAFAATASAQQCESPCVRVAECGWLVELLHHERRLADVAELMRGFVCGRTDGHLIHVCCGSPPGQLQLHAEPKPQPQPEQQAQPEEQPQTEQEQQPKPAGPHTEPKPQPQPEPKPQPQPEQQAHPEEQPQTDQGQQPKPAGPVGPQDPLQHPNLRLLPMDTCGQNYSDGITDGVTPINRYPWLALLLYSLDGGPPVLLCDGALITRRYVLTVAQCIIHKNLNRYKLASVRLGEWDQHTRVDCDGDFCVPPAQDFGIEQSIPHPEYTPKLSNDIALLRLDRDAPYSPFITPICLPVAPEMRQATFVGKNLVVAGWGDTRDDYNTPVKLYIQQPVVDEQTCQQRYSRWNRHIMPSHICAGSKEGNNSCYGRSGSPLMAFEGQPPRGVLIGVPSFGPRVCNKVDTPTVYTRVSSFLTWILDNIRP
ncbi:CLIP domain-containing serine protease HP8-like [Schistocerca cancellata]|uniref:CLIP domain-containing serine protease HP8-like n=1 Tax=Schistocerca cancellata TaxID=274614 RepID=UPI002117C898|nr:CLIP domain-containing serine protease HP8-like [Schistocerca cancellata]